MLRVVTDFLADTATTPTCVRLQQAVGACSSADFYDGVFEYLLSVLGPVQRLKMRNC